MSKKIIVIDDEQGICDLLKRIFESEGYEIKTETDPLKGIQLAEEDNPDCVLLDIKMPAMDGIDVLSKIKDYNKNIGVIMITGYGNIESAMESMKLGAYDYITKPFDIDFIKNLVKRCLEREKS